MRFPLNNAENIYTTSMTNYVQLQKYNQKEAFSFLGVTTKDVSFSPVPSLTLYFGKIIPAYQITH